jgi:hypothetical protein
MKQCWYEKKTFYEHLRITITARVSCLEIKSFIFKIAFSDKA